MSRLIALVLLIVFSIVFAIPFLWMILTSLKSLEEVHQRTVLPQSLHFENYLLALTQIPFLRYTWNTIVITVLCVVGTVVSSSMVAYSMSKVKWK